MSNLKFDIPDVILVRKYYATKSERKWELKNLEYDEEVPLNAKETEANEGDYELFLQELEGDKEMRQNINLYKKSKMNVNTNKMASVGTKNHKDKSATTNANNKKKNNSNKNKDDSNNNNNEDEDNNNDNNEDWEDMDEDNEEEDEDEEAIRLDELLDKYFPY